MLGHDRDVGHGSGVAGVDDRAVVGFAVCGGHRDGPHQVSQRLAVVNAEIEQIEAVAAALSEKVGRREMSVADFTNSYGFLRADLEPLLAERDQLAGGSIDGPTRALSSVEVARHWDEAESFQQRRAMLIDAIGTDQVGGV